MDNTKRYIIEVTNTEEGVNVAFDSFEGQEPMDSVDASMIILALTRTMLESGLETKDLHEFLGNVEKAAIDLHEQQDDPQNDPEIQEIQEIEQEMEENND